MSYPPSAGLAADGVVPLATELARHGDRLALVSGAERLTYAELAERVADFAALLGPARTLVQLEADNSLGSVIAYLAALSTGYPLLVSPGDNPEACSAVAEVYRPGIVIGGGEVRGAVAGGGRGDRQAVGLGLHPDLALLLSTSGSTGSPKLVRLSARNVQANAESIAEYLGITDSDRTITTLPMHYCYGLSVLHSYLLRGAAVVLTDRSVTDPEFWRLLREERITGFAGVPYTFDLLDRIGFADMDLPHLRYLTQAGGRMAPERVRAHAELGQLRGWDLYVMYGQTEATARMAYLPPSMALTSPDAIGVAIPGGRLRVEPVPEAPARGSGSGISEAGASDAGDCQVGELVYTGPNVMMGYAQEPADLARGAELAELRTGDLARVGEDGMFRIVGRRSRFAKVFGMRIDLQQVESALGSEGLGSEVLGWGALSCVGGDEELAVIVERPTMAPPSVAPAAPAERVENCTDSGGDSYSSLHARMPPGPEGGSESPDRVFQTAAGLKAAAARAAGLPESAVRVIEVEVLPRTSTGKPDYAAMGRLAAGTGLESRTGLDSAGVDLAGLKALYSSVLGVAEVRDTDTFVGLGGDSLTYVRMSLRLEKALGRLPKDWQNTPVGEFAPSAADALRAEGRARRWRRRWLREIEMSVLLRAVAIILVVSSHIGVFVLYGGAHVLMAIAGFNFARFQLSPARTRRPTRPLLVSAARIAVPAAVWIGAAAWLTGDYGLDSALLVRQVFGPDDYAGQWWLNWQFWFIEAIVYILLGLAALFAFRRVDGLEKTHPLVLPSGLVVVGLALRYPIAAHSDGPGFMFLAPTVLWLFGLGWVIARATTTRQRLVVTIAAVLLVPGFFTSPARDTVLLAGLLLLLWIPTVWVPALIGRAAGLLASASLYIYLTQFQVYPEFAARTWLPVLACVVVGLVFWQVVEQAERGLSRLRSRVPRARPRRSRSGPSPVAAGSSR